MPKRTEDNIKVGARFENNQGDWFTIVGIKNTRYISIVFDTDPDVPCVKSKWHILDGKARNKNKPVMAGVGFIGYGEYTSSAYKDAYCTWSNMLRRCYLKDHKGYNSYGGRGVYVVSEWHNFQNFCSWFLSKYVQGFDMDKDLKRGNCYSPETVVFIPPRVNGLLVSSRQKRSKYGVGVHKTKYGTFASNIKYGNKTKYLGSFNNPEDAFITYKITKEHIVKDLADEFKNQITEEVYNLLIEWEAERFPE